MLYLIQNYHDVNQIKLIKLSSFINVDIDVDGDEDLLYRVAQKVATTK